MLSKSHSGFRMGDSCISQLLVMIHEIYSKFNACPSLATGDLFLGISNDFDRVWDEGLF